MIKANLVFGDIDGHSKLPLRRRAETLDAFRDICMEYRPGALADSRESFYDVDNDRLMAGFADVPDLRTGPDVVRWTANLWERLVGCGVKASFGVNLVSYTGEVPWRTQPGLIEGTGDLYLEDERYRVRGRVERVYLTGDCLTVAARLIDIAKLCGCSLALSAQNWYPEPGPESLRRDARLGDRLRVEDVTDKIEGLGLAKAATMRSLTSQVFGIWIIRGRM